MSTRKQCKTQNGAPYLVYGRNSCPYTQRALEALDEKKISYTYVDISDYQSEFFKLCAPKIGKNYKTVPVIFRQGKFIGGSDELMKHLK
jgi:glutaredoxin